MDKLYSILESRAGGKVEPQECVVEEVAASAQVKETSILKSDNIILGLKSESKEEAIERAGKMLVKEGYVNNNYIAAMQEREKIVSTYIGMGIAIPHGVGEAKKEVKESGIVVNNVIELAMVLKEKKYKWNFLWKNVSPSVFI